jgi:hypothetical protein
MSVRAPPQPTGPRWRRLRSMCRHHREWPRWSLWAVLLCTTLLVVPAASDEAEPSPVVSWLHTLSIHVRSHAIHDSLHTLLAETLQLPRTYEPVQYGEKKYVAVWAGNIALEPCGPYPPEDYLSTDFEAMFYGLTFAFAESATASAAALDARGIGHAEVTDVVRIEDEDLKAPNVYVGIGCGGDAEGVREPRALLEARKGGPLGLLRVEEIRVGYSDETNLRKWIAFLQPHPRVGERAFRVAGGPVLRFEERDVKQVLGITLKVRSLEKAAAFLREQGLLGDVTVDSVTLDRARTHGLHVLVKE